jgi:phthiocerol/phenolphthiocerol synthesis type-I polyketide synthase C
LVQQLLQLGAVLHNFVDVRGDVAVVGWSCRLPGANSMPQLWSLLTEGRCAISQVPAERFALEHFGHPRRQERGRSYTWAAGVLDDIWGFDPAPFGISPREAQQMDPQQRILLQLTWEALEDAGIRPSTIAGDGVGVYVGASQTEYAQAFFGDPAIGDAHFATGNSLAVLANRISYVYDLHGPSITVDTACSSSLVALHEACEALRSGRIETAIVGGINIITAPTSFIFFSQAAMLSPTGLCRAFSADADGFVRAEGGAVVVLRRLRHARVDRNPIRGLIIASDVNSDGRTSGIALPSADAQESLLRGVYSAAGIEPGQLAFVEAHGTGTPAGDPIEAYAIGRSLGSGRATPLPIGSIKTNIGHLEPASGLAGLLKALLALEHGTLPPTLNCNEPNPHITFDDLNITVCRAPLSLPDAMRQYAGINSFGFGGTNAHVIVAPHQQTPEPVIPGRSLGSEFVMLSAQTKPSLVTLASKYVDHITGLSDREMSVVAAAAAHRRDRLTNRLIVTSTKHDVVHAALEAFLAQNDHPALACGEAPGSELPVAFVYSGNGGQWAGMGVTAYQRNSAFREHFDAASREFEQLAGWSLTNALLDSSLGDRLNHTSVAQPLIFAIQSAGTAALRARGIKPVVTLGHSVGEVAAAEAAGIFDLKTAVRVIYCRSTRQELVRNAGRMAAVLAAPEAVETLARELSGIEIAAYNSPRALTVAGSAEALAQFTQLAKRKGIACLDLELDYPFHSALMGPVEAPLVADLAGLVLAKGDVPFISTVDRMVVSGTDLDGHYWWRNVRAPVRFSAAVHEAAKLGARFFLEIGPRSVLGKHIVDNLSGDVAGISTLCVLDRGEEDDDPFQRAIAKALVSGAKIDPEVIAGSDPGGTVALPSYPWQQTSFRYARTPEAIGWFGDQNHPLSGGRYSGDALEWHAFIDTAVLPELTDHKVGDQIILPGTGFVEIALSVARQWLRADDVKLADCEILAPLDLTAGETREVLTRVSPGSQTIEILSRPRLSTASWTLHARAKMISGTGAEPPRPPRLPKEAEVVTHEALYRIADACGLHYGPAFRDVEHLACHQSGVIRVSLRPQETKHAFLLDPLRLDCCTHGVIQLFPGLQAEERGVAYIPVRLDEVTLYHPGRMPQSAVIVVKSTGERSIFFDVFVISSDGNVMATLRGVRCQAVPVRRSGTLEAFAVVERPTLLCGALLGERGVTSDVNDVIAATHGLGLIAAPSAPLSEAAQMLEGWATVAAFEICSALAIKGVVAPELLVGKNRWPAERLPWLVCVLERLVAADLAKEQEGTWTLVQDPLLPKSTSLVTALAAEHPAHAPELLLAAEMTAFAGTLADRAAKVDVAGRLSTLAVDFYDVAARSREEAAELLGLLLGRTPELWPKHRALRILLIGFSSLARTLMAGQVAVDVTVLEPERRKYERAQLAIGMSSQIRVIDQLGGDTGLFDMIVAADAVHRLPSPMGLSDLFGALAPEGLFVAVEPRPSLFHEVVFGLRAPDADAPESLAPRTATDWRDALRRVGSLETKIENVVCGAQRALLVVAKTPSMPAADDVANPALGDARMIRLAAAADTRTSGLRAALAERLDAAGYLIEGTAGNGCERPTLARSPAVVVHVGSTESPISDSVDALGRRCLDIKACAESLGSERATLWLVFQGALESPGHGLVPVETGAWAFARTLANEFQHIDVRKIDLAPGVPTALAAERIAAILHSGTPETELQVETAAIRAVRVEGIARPRTTPAAATAARLERRLTAGQRLIWQPIERRAPGHDEVEIEVAATGLNFRDLMFMLGLLPDDSLEGGFAGPTLGLECAGTVLATGDGVKVVKPGDRVMAFAPSAFSTHATVPAAYVAPIPDMMSLEAAATIPVAFLTAYYALVTLAKLRRNEWLLVHGGAGAVGLAAIQIAQARRAKIIATAGAPAKRDLLRALGVRHVLDSRSTQFADEVRDITGSGVDVVLNSLAGEAMERSLSCMRAFGRFVELGKRDYVTNTHVGLRPFRKNLSYFGVDVDQLMIGCPAAGRKAFAELMRRCADGSFTPLPHSVFGAADVVGAFQLMQQSGHIGKIIVRPPAPGTVPQRGANFVVDAAGTHLVTGGFSGFGLATVRWLADRGARHLVVMGRRGAATTETKALIADFAGRGITMVAEACDVADCKAVDAAFAKIRATMPRLSGVIHSAMVLEDAIIANLDARRLNYVLEPKVRGAINLDRATRDLDLDYFVLYSSVTTLIGNPGQASYVAANAFMEGLARRRRQDGLPALAVGWGPIADVGVVARTEKLQSNLQKLSARGMTAREALDLMARALGESRTAVDGAVITIAPQEGALRADLLPVLKSPTYATFVSRQRSEAATVDKIDLRALVKSDDRDAVRQRVGDVVVAQLARVLHFRDEDISRTRPLVDMGLDSLMALELAMNLEECFGVHFTLAGSAGTLTVTSLADEIIAQASVDEGGETQPAAVAMAEPHLDAVGEEHVALLSELLKAEGRKVESVQP